MKLDDLIIEIQNGIREKTRNIKDILHPELLLSSLKKLNNTIGNSRLKNEVSSQVCHMIAERKRVTETNIPSNNAMTNVMLSGPPGVGKTLIGQILSEIYFSLGIIKGNQEIKKNRKVSNTTIDVKYDNNDQIFLFGFLILSFLGLFGASLMTGMSYVYRQIGFLWFGISLVILLFLILGALLYFTQSDQQPVVYKIDEESGMEKDVDYSQIFVETSRNDFIGQYVGHTAEKTNKLMISCLGKVLFIDEAYALINGNNDTFGAEAVHHINQFMSQHSGELIVIIAGYQDLLQAGPFAVNPGLERRFMWKFNCDGYSADELFDIFKYKCDSSNWKLENENQMKSLFFNNYPTAFEAFGGDVERLVFFSKMAHDSDYMKSTSTLDTNTFTLDNVKQGINSLLSNKSNKNIKSKNSMDKPNIDTDILTDLLSSFRPQQKSHNTFEELN